MGKPTLPRVLLPRTGRQGRVADPTGQTEESPSRGLAGTFDVKSAARIAKHAAYRYLDSPIEELRPLIARVEGFVARLRVPRHPVLHRGGGALRPPTSLSWGMWCDGSRAAC